VLAGAYAVAAVLHPRSEAVLTTYAGVSAGLRAADLVAGLALIIAGALAWLEPRARGVGLLAILAGVAWFGADWEGWDGGPAVVRSLGALTAPFVIALLFQLVCAYPAAWPRRRRAQAVVLGAYGLSAIVTVFRAFFRDPFLDPYCWRNCTDNVFLVDAHARMLQRVDEVWLYSAIALGILVVALTVGRLLAARPAALRRFSPVLVPAALAGAAEAAYAAALLDNPFENPGDAAFSAIFFARALSLGLLAIGLGWSVVQVRRRRVIVSRLALDLGEAPAPGKLQEALATAAGDPALRVAYWLAGSRRFVDAYGETVGTPTPAPGRAITPIIRGGQAVALVEHEVALLDRRELERELGSAARLAVDNERLQAEVRAQLEDLRASRARIVETGDSARRRLERDLHDGAQQRLLALSYDLQLARAASEADGDGELTTLLTSAVGEAQTALRELRELAHGIYPAVLAEAGLAPALASLADEAPLPVELGEVVPERYGPAVENAAYVTVTEAVADAGARQATFVLVDVQRESGRLVVTIRDDGEERTSPLVHPSDRIGALGGSLEVAPRTLRAEIPCE
jgi:signal transduction histidine kinase